MSCSIDLVRKLIVKSKIAIPLGQLGLVAMETLSVRPSVCLYLSGHGFCLKSQQIITLFLLLSCPP